MSKARGAKINILLIPTRCSMRFYPVIQKIINQSMWVSSLTSLWMMLLWEMLRLMFRWYLVNLLNHHLSYYHGFMTATYWNSFIILSIRSKPLIHPWCNENDDNNVIRVCCYSCIWFMYHVVSIFLMACRKTLERKWAIKLKRIQDINDF